MARDDETDLVESPPVGQNGYLDPEAREKELDEK